MRLLPVLFCLAALAVSAQPVHPLEDLSATEYWTVYNTLRAAGRLTPTAHFTSVLLHPPDKQAVLAGRPVPRQADVTLLDEGKSFAALVDITNQRVLSHTPLTGAHASFLLGELLSGDAAAKKDPRILEALKKRGITDLRHVRCTALPVAYRATPEQANTRIGFGACTSSHGVQHDWGRSIEGLTFQMDMAKNTIIKVVDSGAVTIPTADNNYENIPGVPRPHTTPIATSLPLGPGFKITGNEIEWQNWRFRLRLDPRVGPILNLVRFLDQGKPRHILYEAHTSELFVPYMDPALGWNNRAFIDAGQFFSVSPFLKPLASGVDCPAHAHWLPALHATDSGAPKTRSNIACLFERNPESPAWRHGEDEEIFGRPTRQLVLRTAAVIGNYDYILDYRFDPDGTIEFAVGATGVIETKSANEKLPDTSPVHTAPDLGQYVAEHTIGVNHDHYFSFRLDLDVDGPANSFMIHRMVPQRIENDPMRKSIWVSRPDLAKTEKEAILDIDLSRPSMWMFMNPGVRGPLGYPVGYEVMAGKTARSLMSPDDPTQQIGSFSAHQFYVTPYKADERYASGLYPTGSAANDGLADWVKANRPIVNTDIVGWYTLGFHHIPRSEDWPVMPTMWHHFHLRPFHFFPRNPVLDLPRSLATRP